MSRARGLICCALPFKCTCGRVSQITGAREEELSLLSFLFLFEQVLRFFMFSFSRFQLTLRVLASNLKNKTLSIASCPTFSNGQRGSGHGTRCKRRLNVSSTTFSIFVFRIFSRNFRRLISTGNSRSFPNDSSKRMLAKRKRTGPQLRRKRVRLVVYLALHLKPCPFFEATRLKGN